MPNNVGVNAGVFPLPPDWEPNINDFEAIKPLLRQNKVQIKNNVGSIFGRTVGVWEYAYRLPSLLQGISIQSDEIIGIEVEVENIQERPEISYFWLPKEDGSLRNNGVEYVTYPTPAKYIPTLLKILFDELEVENKPDFSKRTSVHVHVNAVDMTPEEVSTFLLLYLSMEGLLFNFAGEERSKSIFCVPLTHAGYLNRLSPLLLEKDNGTLYEIVRGWHKYTALNLHTLRNLGTIEFRHMPGNNNVVKLSQWVTLIVAIKETSKKYTTDEVFKQISMLNTTSEYEQYLYKTLGSASDIFANMDLQTLMEGQISYIKNCFLPQQEYKISEKHFNSSSMFQYNKLSKLEFNMDELENYSYETLHKRMTHLSSLYHKTSDLKKQEDMRKQYEKIQTFLTKKGYF